MTEFRKIRTAIGLMMALTASGCAGASHPGTSASPLIGKWQQKTLGSGSESKPCPTQISVSDGGVVSCGQHDTVEFKTDGTFIAQFSAGAIQAVGTWRVQDSTLLVTFTAPQEAAGVSRSTGIEFTPDGRGMTIKAITGGTPTVETYVRN